ncbi:MAG: mechanosensitive ion channel protein MscS [Bacillota bacterium]|nr:MAG: mechanosensitive ion channel protein MscS [Bacillota bacterium]
MDFEQILQSILQWLSTSGVKLVLGLIAFVIACKIVNALSKRVKKQMEKKNTEKTIVSVTYKVMRTGLKLLLFVLLLGFWGIDTAGIGAVIASAGVAVGLAMQGSLSNLAGGILIVILRPFRLGDYIEAQGEGGTVEEISIFYTYLVSPDNKTIMIPNGSLLNGNITNYSKKSVRRVDLLYSVSYGEDFERAKAAILDVISKNEMIMQDPAPFVRVKTHGASSIDIVTRVWVNSGDYWSVYFQMQEDVKKRFDEEGISIPYPQLDVHLDKAE